VHCKYGFALNSDLQSDRVLLFGRDTFSFVKSGFEPQFQG
jgi:hypothetical protein